MMTVLNIVWCVLGILRTEYKHQNLGKMYCCLAYETLRGLAMEWVLRCLVVLKWQHFGHDL